MRVQRCRNNLKFRNTKHSAKYIEKCIALDATDTVARPSQVQVENQLCHTATIHTLTNEHIRGESQQTGLQCTFSLAWNDLMFNWF